MKAYRGTFKKKNGELREMLFAEISDIPSKFIENRVSGTGVERKYPEGMRLVFDLEADDFRVFNDATAVESLQEIELQADYFD